MMISSPPVVSATDKALKPIREILEESLPTRPSPSTIHRWIFGRNDSGLRLPAVKIQGKWFTNPEAVNWFFNERTRREIESATSPSDVLDTSDSELAAVGL